MTEEKSLINEIGNLVNKVKPKEKKSKVNYWMITLIIMAVLLVSQTLQLSIIKAQISKGNFGASSVPASNNDLPSMAGGC